MNTQIIAAVAVLTATPQSEPTLYQVYRHLYPEAPHTLIGTFQFWTIHYVSPLIQSGQLVLGRGGGVLLPDEAIKRFESRPLKVGRWK